jgi:hypothetical protein
MSTVAIFVTKGTIFAGSAAMSSACLAMGIGVGAAFYLHYRHAIRHEERQRLSRELENACYRVRQRIESLPEALQTKFADDLENLLQLENAVKTAISADELCAIPAAIAALHELYTELRRRIEPALIALQEPSAEALDAAIGLRSQLDNHIGLAQLAPLAAELQAILDNCAPAEMLEAIRSLEQRAGLLILQLQQQPGVAEEAPPVVAAPDSRERRCAFLANEAKRFQLLIARHDASAAKELIPFVEELTQGADEQRHKLVRDMIRLKYGALKEAVANTTIYREILESLPGQVRNIPGGGEIATDIERLLGQSSITTEEYNEGVRQAHDFLFRRYEEQALLGRVRDTLEQLGYATVPGVDGITEEGLLAGEVFFVETPWEGYRVMLRLSAQGELLTRLVHLVANEEEKQNRSSYQRQKDLEVAKRWCGDYDRFMAELGEQGVSCSVNLRKAPEEEEILCIIDASVKHKQKYAATSDNYRLGAIQ